jgi:regulator of sirC expression with transglutaminase-like and TPR domain
VTDSPSRTQLCSIVDRPEGEIDIARASLLVACEEYPALDVDGYLRRIDTLAGGVREAAAPSLAGQVTALNRVLFEEQGFRGNVREYYDPRNSFLNDVIDRRVGIPITLSTVYIAVGRRAGLSVHGVGLPGHFLVRVGGGGEEALVDPFHGGSMLTEADCQQRLDRIYGGRVKLAPEMLAACPARALLSRTIRNLKAIYLKEGDLERALRTADLLVLLNPEASEEMRDHALVLAALDCYSLAARELEAYLAAAPQAADAEAVRARIHELRRKASRVN